MNTRSYARPEIIFNVNMVGHDGNDIVIGDRVAGISVERIHKGANGIVEIDIHNFRENENLVITVALSELLSAITFATLNAIDNSVK